MPGPGFQRLCQAALCVAGLLAVLAPGATAQPLPLHLAAAPAASRWHRALKAGYGSEFLTSEGDCLSAVSSVPSDVPIDGIDCGTSGGSASGAGSPAGCPADTAGPTSLAFMQGAVAQAVSSNASTSVAQTTALAAAQLLAQFYSSGNNEVCLARAPAYFAQLGQATQQVAASVCRNGSAGADLATAVAGIAGVMWDAVSLRLSSLSSIEEAVQLAAQAALPSLTKGYKALVEQCDA